MNLSKKRLQALSDWNKKQLFLLKNAEDIAPVLELEEGLSTLVQLASPSPFEQILGTLKAYQAKEGKIESFIMTEMYKIYDLTKKELGKDFMDFVKQYMGGKKTKPQDWLEMYTSDKFQSLLDKHLASIEIQTTEVAKSGAIDASILGQDSYLKEFDIIQKDDYAVQGMIGSKGFQYIDPIATAQSTIAQIVASTQKVTLDVKSNIIKELTEGAQAGEGIPQLRNRLMKATDLGKNRADIIARWAVIKSFNETREAQYLEAKKVLPALKKCWVAALDGRTCPWCAALHGTTIEVEGAFDEKQSFAPPSQNLKTFGTLRVPPRHPRCRCTVVSWLDSWRYGTGTTPEDMIKAGKKWAEENGYAPKAFVPEEESQAVARMNEIMNYLSKNPDEWTSKMSKAYLAEVTALKDVKFEGMKQTIGYHKQRMENSLFYATQREKFMLAQEAKDLQKMKQISGDVKQYLSTATLATKTFEKQIFSLYDDMTKWMKAYEASLIPEELTKAVQGMMKWDFLDNPSDFEFMIDDLAILQKYKSSSFQDMKPAINAGIDHAILISQDLVENLMAEANAMTNIKGIQEKIDAAKLMGQHLNENAPNYSISKLIDDGVKFMETHLEAIKPYGTLETAFKMPEVIMPEVQSAQQAIDTIAGTESIKVKFQGLPPYFKNQLQSGMDEWNSKSENVVAAWVKKKQFTPEEMDKALAYAKGKVPSSLISEMEQAKKKVEESQALAQKLAQYQGMTSTQINSEAKAAGIPYLSVLSKDDKVFILSNGKDHPKSQVKIKAANQKLTEMKKKTKDNVVKAKANKEAFAEAIGDIPVKEELSHPGEKEIIFSLAPNQPSMKGAHQKWMLTDQDGNQWMFKPQPEFLAKGEEGAHKIGQVLGYDLADIKVIESKGEIGAAQKMFKVSGDLSILDPSDLNPEQLKQIQEHQVLDWFISNHDAHKENFMITLDGNIVGIDKGQAFRFFGKDKLEIGWRPNTNPMEQYYDNLWRAYERKEIDLDLYAIDQVLQKIENTPDHVLIDMVREYAVGRDKLTGKGSWSETAFKNSDDFFKGLITRKNNIRKDFEQFYKDRAKARGIKWEGFGQARPAQKEPEKPGVFRKIDSTLMKAVEKAQWQGQSFFVAGKDVEAGNILVWEELDQQGKKVVRASLKIRDGQEQGIISVLSSVSPGVGTGSMQAQPIPEDKFWDDILSAIKNLNYHINNGDMQFNQSKIDTAMNHKQTIKDILIKYDLDTPQFDMAEKYAGYLNQIEKASEKLVPIENTSQYLLTPEKPKESTTLKSKVQSSKGYVQKRVTEFLPNGVLKQTGNTQSFSGTMFKGETQGISFEYIPHKINGSSNGYVAQQGLLELELKNYSGMADEVEKLIYALRDIGVDVSAATEKDLEVLYWRQLMGSIRESKEGDAYGGVYAQGLKNIDSRSLNATGADDEIKIIKEELGKVMGEDAINRADWRPKYEQMNNDPNDTAGWAYWERPDIGDWKDLDKIMGGDGLSHHLGDEGRSLPDIIRQNGYALNTEQRNRIGINMSGAVGMSASSDMGSGGANYFFLRLGEKAFNYHNSGSGFLVFNPNITRRMSNITYSSDKFGRISERRDSRYWNPSTWGQAKKGGSNETIIKNGVNLLEHGEIIFVGSQDRRNEVLKALKEKGYSTWRGLPAEERVMVVRNGNEAEQKYKEFFAKHKENIFKDWKDAPEPPAPAKKARKSPAKKPKENALPEKVTKMAEDLYKGSPNQKTYFYSSDGGEVESIFGTVDEGTLLANSGKLGETIAIGNHAMKNEEIYPFELGGAIQLKLKELHVIDKSGIVYSTNIGAKIDPEEWGEISDYIWKKGQELLNTWAGMEEAAKKYGFTIEKTSLTQWKKNHQA